MIQKLKDRLQIKINYINALTAEKDKLMKALKDIDVELTQAIGAANELHQFITESEDPEGPEATTPPLPADPVS
jgi:hypothetical protein